MRAAWREAPVSSLLDSGALRVEDGNHGEYRPRSHEFASEGVPFIRAADLADGRILFDRADRINHTALARVRKGVGAPGDVILSHKGTVGRVAAAALDSEAFVCSPQTTFWRVLDEATLDRRFLYYLLQSPHFKRQLTSRKSETDMADYVSLTAQRSLKLLLPEIEQQREIGTTLGALDDKIEQNRRINRMLEAMARAIFKSWFVDFDPIRARAEGRQPGNMSAETAELFPSRMNDSALGPIPEGWEVSSIGHAVQVLGGSTPSTEDRTFWDGSIPFATPKDLAQLKEPVLLRTARRITQSGVEMISSGTLPQGTVLLSSRAPIGYLAIAGIALAVNQGFIAMVCDGSLPNVYVFEWTRENMELIKSNAGGTTFPEISKKNFRPLPVLIPSSEVLEHFEDTTSKLYLRIRAGIEESLALAALRDSLLPQLMSEGTPTAPDEE